MNTAPQLPGAQGDAPNPPPLPGSQPQPVPAPVPASWQDPIRIIRTVLDLWEKDPVEAELVHAFAKEKLARIAAGK